MFLQVHKIGLPFTRTLAHDQHHGFLIAFPDEHPDQDHQSVFSDLAVFDKASTAIRITVDMLLL